MLQFLEQNSLAIEAHLDHLRTLMNIENYLDYFILNVFVNNIDWPGTNLVYFRRQVPYKPGAPFGADGRWHWALNDMEFGYNWYNPDDYAFDTLQHASATDGGEWPPNWPWSTFLIRKLLENESMRWDFVNRFGDLLNTVFRTEHMLEVLDLMKTQIEPEIEKHILRWGYPAPSLAQYASLRPGY